MRIELLEDAQAVARRAADTLAELVRAKPTAVLVLPAGATPIPLFLELVGRARVGALDLSRARIFQLDELLGVGPDDPRSFQALLRRHLVGPLGLERGFAALDGAEDRPEEEIERHRRALADAGGADLALLGIGRNGHVAFNEPGSTRSDRARLTPLAASTIEALEPEFPLGPPRAGLTLGLAELAAARRLLLLATGAAKAQALAELLGSGGAPRSPAAELADHPDFSVLCDRAAAPRRVLES